MAKPKKQEESQQENAKPQAVKDGILGQRHFQRAKELFLELERIRQSSLDFITPQSNIRAEQWEESGPSGWGIRALDVPVDGQKTTPTFDMTQWSEKQLLGALGIPVQYVNAMKAAGYGDLVCLNVNKWLAHAPERRKLVRTVDGRMRGFLSDRYKVVDNVDVGLTAFDEVNKAGGAFNAADLTESHMYLNALNWDRPIDIQNERYYSGIQVRNSDVGGSAVSVVPYLFRSACQNGLVYSSGLRAIHLGTTHVDGVLSPETIASESKTILLKVRDMVKASMSDTILMAFREDVEKCLSVKLPSLEDGVNVVQNKYGLSAETREELLKHLLDDETTEAAHKHTAWGIANALTGVAREKDADTAYELGKVAGDLLAEVARQPKLLVRSVA